MTLTLGEKLKKLPKIELHCHLDGSIRPSTILDIALQENIDVPTTNLEEFKAFVQVPKECPSLKAYLKKFDLAIQVMQKPNYITRITEELLEDLSNQNVKYVEIRFAPFFFMMGGMSFEEVVESVIKAMATGREKYGIRSNILLACMRHHPLEKSIEVVEKGKKYLGKGVVGIDLAGNEHDYPPELHKEAFKLAKQYGFHRTVHAGETGLPKNIVTSINGLHAERLGHGVHAYMDEEALSVIKEKEIPLELCLSSNVQTKAVKDFESHPIKSYLDQGIIVTVNTDNVVVSNTSLEKEYGLLMEKQNFKFEDLKKVIMNAVNASFTDEKEKTILRALFLEELVKL